MDIELEDAAIHQVTRCTEGWWVGLQLMGLSLQGHAPPGASISLLEEASGTQHYILDYLTEEVLQQQPAAIQSFLLRTSILSRLSAPLCDAVLQQQGSQQLLESLHSCNLFVTTLDNQRHWYRYHDFFAEVLRARLEQTPGEEIHMLLCAAIKGM